jgi:hypothetical protein
VLLALDVGGGRLTLGMQRIELLLQTLIGRLAAFRLARVETGKTVPSYSRAGSRSALLLDPEFAKVFRRAKARIRNMELRYIEETNALRQALLEIYVSIVLSTPHNDFENH